MFCPQCGIEVGENQVFCHGCGGRIAASSPGGALRGKTDWELRGETGAVRGMLRTLRESLFNPTLFFKKMPLSGGLSDPTLYAMISGIAGMAMLVLWQALFHDALPSLVPGSLEKTGGGGAPLVALFVPLLIVANLHLCSGMFHLLLVLAHGAKSGYEATFRVVAYSSGAMVLLALPFCGWPVAALWSMTLAVIGLKEVQGATGGKAAFAVLFPLLFCCAVAALFALLAFGTLAASFGTMPHTPWK